MHCDGGRVKIPFLKNTIALCQEQQTCHRAKLIRFTLSHPATNDSMYMLGNFMHNACHVSHLNFEVYNCGPHISNCGPHISCHQLPSMALGSQHCNCQVLALGQTEPKSTKKFAMTLLTHINNYSTHSMNHTVEK